MRAKDISRIKLRNSTPTKIVAPKSQKNDFNFTSSIVKNKQQQKLLKTSKQSLIVEKYKEKELKPNKYYQSHYPQKNQQFTILQINRKKSKQFFDKKHIGQNEEYHSQGEVSQTLQMLKLIYIQIFGQKKYINDYNKFQKMQSEHFQSYTNSQTQQQDQFNLQGKLFLNIMEQIKRLKNQMIFQQIHKNQYSKLQDLNRNRQHQQNLLNQSYREIKSLKDQNKKLNQKNEQLSQQLQILKEEFHQLEDHKERLTHLNECKFKKIQQLKKELTYCNDYIDEKEDQLSQLIQEKSRLQTTLKLTQDQHNKTVIVMKNLEQSVLDCKIQNQNQLQQKFKVQGFIWALQEIDNQIKKLKLESIEIKTQQKNIINSTQTLQNKNKATQLQQTMNFLISPQTFEMFSTLKYHTFSQYENKNLEQNELELENQYKQHSTNFN